MIRFVLPLFLLAACSSGDGRPAGQPESKTYDVQGFTSVSAETGVVITLKQGPFAVSAQSHDGDLSRLRVNLRGPELNISSSGMFTMGRSPTYEVSITAPTVNALSASAGAKITANDLNLSDVRLSASAGGMMTLTGSCWAATVDAAAGAIVTADGLKCQTAKVDAAAGGQVSITATDKADATAAAGGIVNLSGNPPTVTKNATVGGIINVK